MPLIVIVIFTAAVSSAENSTSNLTVSQEKMNESALKSLLVNATSNFASYQFQMELNQTTELFNLSNPPEKQTIHIRSFGVGSLNTTNQSLKLVLASLAVPLDDKINATATALEEYLQNDTVYMKIDGSWTRMSLSVPDLWAAQDQAGQLELLNQSNITISGSETVEGKDCYKISVVPAMQSYAKAADQAGSLLGALNLIQLFNNSTMDLTYWIDKESLLLAKAEQAITLDLDPASLGLPLKGPAEQRMRIKTESTIYYRDYNKSVQITLPPEAKNAVTLSFNLPTRAKQ